MKRKDVVKNKINKKTLIKTIIITVIVAITALLLVWIAMAAVSAYTLVSPNKNSILTMPEELGLYYENITVQTDEGISLSGWFIPSQINKDDFNSAKRTVIFSHNYQSNREMIEINAIYYARRLVHEGFNVVMFDYSGCGSSGGSYYTLGVSEKDELNDVINYVKEMLPDTDIAVHGWAFGAAAAIMAGAENENVSTIISDSSYVDLDSYLNENISTWTLLPTKFLNSPVKPLAELFCGADFSEASPLKSVTSMTGKNIYFIHSENDYVFPPQDSQTLYTAAKENNNADIWNVEKSLHIYAYVDQSDNYVSRVVGFLDDVMKKEA